jgi:hypothetical protein
MVASTPSFRLTLNEIKACSWFKEVKVNELKAKQEMHEIYLLMKQKEIEEKN